MEISLDSAGGAGNGEFREKVADQPRKGFPRLRIDPNLAEMFFKKALVGLSILTSLALNASDPPPSVIREFRGAWVPSVGNLQWPSTPGLTTAEQKAELIAILNRAQELNLNAIILQVRPSCDALYSSPLEPWSEYLTGEMGRAPSPFYDPLLFAVTEAHRRGLELHAWMNPFRARVLAAKSPISPRHVIKKYPAMVINHGKFVWLDPGQKFAQDYSLAVMADIVRRYDIDGIHMDDYFYPYSERDGDKKDLPFRDDASWRRYQSSGGKLSRSDWRRQNVNEFIQRAYQNTKAQKPWVKFGVSPFGIWKPGFPLGTSLKSGNMYEEIYCDSLKWWTNGWVDYLAPQLYWAINPPDQSFTALLKWWAENNPRRRNLWPGINTGNSGGKWKAEEIVNQIKATRAQSGAGGVIHWSMKNLMNNGGGIADQMKSLYSEPALVPASPWLNDLAPEKPIVTLKAQRKGRKVQWDCEGEKPRLWTVQIQMDGKWKTQILPGGQSSLVLPGVEKSIQAIAVSAVNRYGTQSPPAVLEILK
ncbi:MAG: family 10 glycosylhydrolase [Verrucomicrobiota bacterium]